MYNCQIFSKQSVRYCGFSKRKSRKSSVRNIINSTESSEILRGGFQNYRYHFPKIWAKLGLSEEKEEA
eukprot:g7681.t1